MMNPSYESFARDIVTVSQRDSLTEDLQVLITNLYQTSTPLRKHIESMFLPEQAEWLLKAIKQPLNIERLHTTETFLNELIKSLQTMRVCTLTVAIALTLDQLIDIQEWLTRTIGTTCFIDLKIDKSLIAGAQIQFEGRYVDKSVKVLLTNDEIIRHIS